MRHLMRRGDETVNMGVEIKGYVVFIAQLESHHSIRAFHRRGRSDRSMLQVSAKAMLL